MSDDLYFQVVLKGYICQSLARSQKKYPKLERGLGFQYPIGYLKFSALVEMNMRSLSWQWSVEGNQYFGSYCRLKGRKTGGTMSI